MKIESLGDIWKLNNIIRVISKEIREKGTASICILDKDVLIGEEEIKYKEYELSEGVRDDLREYIKSKGNKEIHSVIEMEADKEEIDPYIQGRIQDMMRYILVTITKRRIEDKEEKEEYRRIVRKIVDELRKTGADELTKVINEVHGCIVKEIDKEGYFKDKESEINEVLYEISGALQTIRGKYHGDEYKVEVDIKRLIKAIER